MSNIVLSGINLVEGGTLTIYKEILSELIKLKYNENNKIVAFVHSKELFQEFQKDVDFIEIPKSKKSWLYRMYYEYIYFNQYSKKHNVDIWISMHDMTPNVKANKRYVYCHNTSPFYRATLKKDGYKLYLFSKFYKYLYKINIKKNTGVIVQQEWIRKEFEKMYKINNVIVARPSQIDSKYIAEDKANQNDKYTFIFASFPRTFKNFEIICEASKLLKEQNIKNFEVILTIDGTENRYSNKIVNDYKYLDNIKFVGLQKQDKLFELYNQSNCMIFPSKLESWGLPITEFKITKKPIILADMPYAHETIGKYDKPIFFNPNNAKQLSQLMLNEINHNCDYIKTEETIIEEPYAKNWKELLRIIIDGRK